MMDIRINTPFKVSFKKGFEGYNAICLSTNNGESFCKNLIKNTDNGELFTVEDNWFDYELTGRKITYDNCRVINFDKKKEKLIILDILQNTKSF